MINWVPGGISGEATKNSKSLFPVSIGGVMITEPTRDIRLLDTNIVSFLMNRDSRIALYMPHLEGHRRAISVMTVAELCEGAYRAKWGRKRFSRLERTINSYVVLPVSMDVCRKWGEVRSQRKHKPIAHDDAWISATALTFGYALVTHNPQDFVGIPGLQVITALEPT
jgi:tRNA(fMet)-specific endonuclease VapC